MKAALVFALAAMRSREWEAFGFHPPCTYLTSAEPERVPVPVGECPF